MGTFSFSHGTSLPKKVLSDERIPIKKSAICVKRYKNRLYTILCILWRGFLNKSIRFAVKWRFFIFSENIYIFYIHFLRNSSLTRPNSVESAVSVSEDRKRHFVFGSPRFHLFRICPHWGPCLNAKNLWVIN